MSIVNAENIPIKTTLFVNANKDGLDVNVQFRTSVPVRQNLYALVSQLTIDRCAFVLSAKDGGV